MRLQQMVNALLLAILAYSSTSIAFGQVIFETNFGQDTGWSATTKNSINQQSNTPFGWTAYKVPSSGNADMIVETGAGINSSNALKLTWSTGNTSLAVSLSKHLSNVKEKGYDELYIRYHLRYADNWKTGSNGSDTNYWKWGRLHQNTHATDQSQWTENRIDSYYVVWTLNGKPNPYYTSVWADNVGSVKGSAGGPSTKVDWASNPITQGHFETVQDWIINRTTNPGLFNKYPGNQGWHTIEFHFKLATIAMPGNGVFEISIDGVKQDPWIDLSNRYGAPSYTGIPTLRNGSGFNFFTFFDNMAYWSAAWNDSDGPRHLYVNDVVVSNDPIGHAYVAGNTDNPGLGSSLTAAIPGPDIINLPIPIVN